MKKKLMRFMGVNELAAFLACEELENHTDWRKRAQSTDSSGFCFFDLSEPPEEVKVRINPKPEQIKIEMRMDG